MNNKGLTLIELILAIAISGILISVTYFILGTNVKILQKTNSNMDLQQNGQFISEFILEKVIHSSKILDIRNESGESLYNTNKKVNLGTIIMESDNENDSMGYAFSLRKNTEMNSYDLKYGEDINRTPGIEAGNYIKSIEMTPIPQGYLYNEAKGIEFTINLIKDQEELSITKKAYFRNYKQ